MLKTRFLLRAGVLCAVLCGGLTASAGTITATFNFEDATQAVLGGLPVIQEESNGVIMEVIGAASLCDVSGVGFTNISGLAAITGYDCGPGTGQIGSTVIFFSSNLLSLTLDYATDDRGKLDVEAGDITASAPGGDFQIGSYRCHNHVCGVERTLSISGIGEFNVVVFDVESVGTPDYALDNISVVAETPEPSSLALLGTGALGLLGAVRRRVRK